MKRAAQFGLLLIPLLSALGAFAQHNEHGGQAQTKNMSLKNHSKMPMRAGDCDENQTWDYSMGSCRQLAMADMPMSMWMVHGNAFLVQTFQEGPRGRNRIAAPNMVMAEAGRSVGSKHFIDVNLMLTAERWTFPKEGYPELYQIGERNEDEKPYIDGQHPHSSPIMGLTFSDTIRLGDGKDHLRLFFAPRGQATEGPTAFMHRPTGMINPDAPLGHHIGQDVSHITSTVFGASLGLGRTRIEASAFNGTEPEPSKVDLPLGTLNSYAGRLIYEFSDNVSAMASAGYFKEPESHDPTLDKVYHYSASVYVQHHLSSGWMFHDAFIFGVVNNYDHISALRSFLYEFWLHSESPSNYWGRIEFVERSASQLGITTAADPLKPRGVTALTAGYTYDILKFENSKFGLGASVTKNISPSEFRDSYGGDPWSGKIFVQLGGMKMGDFSKIKLRRFHARQRSAPRCTR